MRQILTCLFVFALVTLLNGSKFRCDYKYSDQAEGWLKLHRIPANWTEARLRCHLEGSNLASPLNLDLSVAMQKAMQNASVCGGVFTGISGYFSTGDLHSIEGIPLSDIPQTWHEGEPDNHNNDENCILMLDTGELADVSCAETFPYLCYRKGSTVPDTGTCGPVDNGYSYDTRTGSCYKIPQLAQTWSRAYMICAAEGGHLAIINSDTEATVLLELFTKHQNSIIGREYEMLGNAFIGFHDRGEYRQFLTIEGETLEKAGFAKFYKGEPNAKRDQKVCGTINFAGQLDDAWCDKPTAFICEKKPESCNN
ncbi:macrophage mannose receptor 1-like [Bicyclus anynana]|uniref:Macrophage mannose receptor 1-like n=1 Tax=Bicyclus anynana TaxID=110368 RepID=A0A6J1P0E5_BICAN|nr:macrophage mannose receptor 1-like [Bicyclus anynana]